MFGYSTALRSMTQVKTEDIRNVSSLEIGSRLHVKFCCFFLYLSVQGKGEFTMEYKDHLAVSHDVQKQLVNSFKGTKEAG